MFTKAQTYEDFMRYHSYSPYAKIFVAKRIEERTEHEGRHFGRPAVGKNLEMKQFEFWGQDKDGSDKDAKRKTGITFQLLQPLWKARGGKSLTATK